MEQSWSQSIAPYIILNITLHSSVYNRRRVYILYRSVKLKQSKGASSIAMVHFLRDKSQFPYPPTSHQLCFPSVHRARMLGWFAAHRTVAMDRCVGYVSDINTASPILLHSSIYSEYWALLFYSAGHCWLSEEMSIHLGHLQGLQYDALTHPEARNVHVCLSVCLSLPSWCGWYQSTPRIPVLHMVFTCIIPGQNLILYTEYEAQCLWDIYQVPEVPDNPRMRSISPPQPQPPPGLKSNGWILPILHTISPSPPPCQTPSLIGGS